MKKLMVILAAVAMAAAAQAATTSWGLSTGKISFQGTYLAGQQVNLYLVGVSGSDNMLYDTRATATSPKASVGKLVAGTGDLQKDNIATGTYAGGKLLDGEGADAGRQYYMVITYTSGSDTYTYTSSKVASTGLTGTSLGSVAFTFNDNVISSGTDGWVKSEPEPTPEPTSAMLLLLGVAGLALKRKQK